MRVNANSDSNAGSGWNIKASLLAGTAALAVAASPALAQEPETEPEPVNQREVLRLGEVMVTAQRREENLQQVPVAVSAFSAEMLEQRQIDNVSGLQNAVPSLTIVSGRASSNVAQVSLRGVGQMSQTLQFDPGVGIYVDDVYLARAQGSLFDLYGVSRVEVLRGPQGTLYGRNTIGGAIKIVSERPDPSEFGGRLRGRTGSYELLDLGASLNVPIIEDQAAIRLDALRRFRKGFQKNANGTRGSSTDVLGARISGLFRPTSDVEILLNLDGTDDQSSVVYGRQMRVLDYGDFGTWGPTPTAPHRTDSAILNDNFYKNWGTSANIGWHVNDALTLRSITAFRRNWFQARIDPDATPADLWKTFQRQEQEQFSQELQASIDAGSFNLVAGLFYFQEESESHIVSEGLFAVTPALVLPLALTQDSDLDTESWAVFAHGAFELSPNLTLGAGLRYSRDTKSTSLFGGVETSFESVTPRVSLDYRVTSDLLIYGSYAQGFKAGSYNVLVTATPTPFEPETVDSWEAGIKSDWLDGQLRLNLALFYATYEDFQADTFITNPNDGTPLRVTFNAAEATTKGAELEAFWRPTPNFDVSATYAYLDARFDDYSNSPFGDLSGTPLANAPKHTIGLSTRYVAQLGDNFQLALQADATSRSRNYRYPGLTDIVEKPNTIINAQATLMPNAGPWQWSVGVKNLTDEVVLSDGYDFDLGFNRFQTFFYREPRMWTTGITYSF